MNGYMEDVDVGAGGDPQTSLNSVLRGETCDNLFYILLLQLLNC